MIQPDDILVINTFLSVEECQTILDFAENFGFKPATVKTGSGDKLLSQIRNNERIDFEDETLTTTLWKRVQEHLPLSKGVEATGLDRHLRVYKYSQGQRFKRHKDGSVKGEGTQTQLSFLIFLSEDFSGGQTSFREYSGKGDDRKEVRFDLSPKIGMALLFPHEKWHEGLEVEDGIKYVLRTDVQYPEHS